MLPKPPHSVWGVVKLALLVGFSYPDSRSGHCFPCEVDVPWLVTTIPLLAEAAHTHSGMRLPPAMTRLVERAILQIEEQGMETGGFHSFTGIAYARGYSLHEVA